MLDSSFFRVAFDTKAALADEAAGLLVANGALGCAVRKGALLGPRSKQTVKLEAYFTKLGPAKLRAVRRAMASAGMLATDAHRHAPERIADPGWATMWKERFEPLRIGDRFLIVPPWNCAAEPGRIAIVIQPGQAFGTGHHGTTAGALSAIGELCAERKFAAGLDVGTGSGILAIAMRLAGVGKVVALEVDPVALDNARENAKLNCISRRIRFSAAPLAEVRGRFGLVAANILSSVLIRLAPDLKRVLARGGRLVLGGILERERAKVAAHFRPELRLLSTRTDRGWATMVLAR